MKRFISDVKIVACYLKTYKTGHGNRVERAVTLGLWKSLWHLLEQSWFVFGTQWLLRLTSVANSTWYIEVQFQAIHCKYGGFTRKIINLSWEIPVWLCAERCFTSIAVGLLP